MRFGNNAGVIPHLDTFSGSPMKYNFLNSQSVIYIPRNTIMITMIRMLLSIHMTYFQMGINKLFTVKDMRKLIYIKL